MSQALFRTAAGLAVVPLTLVLGGCGGGGGTAAGGPSVATASLPQLQNNVAAFASATESFPVRARFLGSTGSAGSQREIEFTVRLAPDGSGNLIFDDGAPGEFTLVRRSSGDYALSDPTLSLFAEGALGRDVGTVLVVLEQVGGSEAGFAVIGRESVDVQNQSGKAIYLGPSAFLAVANNGAVNGGSGGFILEADFDTRSVDGVIALTDTSVQNGTQFRIEFENAPISGAGFSATDLRQNGLNATVTGSSLDAAFYGPGAGEVGGNYTMDLQTGATQTWIAGALIGNRQTFTAEDLAAAAAAAQSGQSSINVGGETIVLGSGSVVGGSGSVYPSGASTYYNSNTGVSFGADGGGCYYVGDWSNC